MSPDHRAPVSGFFWPVYVCDITENHNVPEDFLIHAQVQNVQIVVQSLLSGFESIAGLPDVAAGQSDVVVIVALQYQSSVHTDDAESAEVSGCPVQIAHETVAESGI